jgi:hypothetical protein
MNLAIDFDGTIAEHEFPQIGPPVPYAFSFLRAFRDLGAKLILWTMRSDETLAEAVEFCRQNGVEFWGVNGNPEQHEWTNSPKAYAQIYIDDAAFGCPLIYPSSGRPYVDWLSVGPRVIDMITR